MCLSVPVCVCVWPKAADIQAATKIKGKVRQLAYPATATAFSATSPLLPCIMQMYARFMNIYASTLSTYPDIPKKHSNKIILIKTPLWYAIKTFN